MNENSRIITKKRIHSFFCFFFHQNITTNIEVEIITMHNNKYIIVMMMIYIDIYIVICNK